MKLQIKNAWVFDPANGIRGEIMDIFVDGSKIVEEVKPEKVIDAKGMLTMPGGIDLHSHIAGSKINMGRLYRPEDSRYGFKLPGFRARTGISVPNVINTGYTYAEMGYTTVLEPAMPPLKARHTHEEFHDTPMIHKAALTLVDNNWVTFNCIREKDLDALVDFLGWILYATKGYGFKSVNPGGTEAWGFAKNILELNEPVPEFGITPAEIITWLAQANEQLKLPHSLHLHTIALGRPGNFQVTVETIQLSSKIQSWYPRQALHMAHIQFHSYGGTSWRDFCSAAEQVAKAIQKHNVTADTGNVVFGDLSPLGDTTTMTADGPLEYYLHRLTGGKWVNSDVELETGAGIVPVRYSKQSRISCIQWAIGLELMLMVDPWKLALSTDHPNGGPFQFYPWLLSFLVSQKHRQRFIQQELADLGGRIILDSLDAELDYYQIAILTRASPAKILGLSSKGRLDPGSDADIAIYPITQELDPSSHPQEFQAKISRAEYTIISGQIAVAHGNLVQELHGSTLLARPRADSLQNPRAREWVEQMFQKYYSVALGNYPVQAEYIRNPVII